MSALLFTIGPSHFCDKARWALEHAGIKYEERPSAPVVHFVTMLGRGQRTTPLLVAANETVRTSGDIVAFADRALPEQRKLIPSDPALREEALAFASRCDRDLGPAVRRLAYFHLFKDLPELVRVISAPQMPRVQAALFSAMRVPIVEMMRRGMRIDEAGARRSELKVAVMADEVDALLADGRRYLFGDRFSVADLTFAALFAPLVVPPTYGWPLPPLEEAPASLRALCEAYRARPAGAFTQRMYVEQR